MLMPEYIFTPRLEPLDLLSGSVLLSWEINPGRFLPAEKYRKHAKLEQTQQTHKDR